MVAGQNGDGAKYLDLSYVFGWGGESQFLGRGVFLRLLDNIFSGVLLTLPWMCVSMLQTVILNIEQNGKNSGRFGIKGVVVFVGVTYGNRLQ
ncbi:MAG: hypothetical protein FWE62_05660 [Firmicutes bacterium]|nr:hypothetical protein [Bacillota bacterium]